MVKAPKIDLSKPSETIKYVLGLCAIIFVCALLFFSFLRQRFRQIYAPRSLLIENKIYKIRATASYFSWIVSILKISDEDIYTFAGLDALVFLRFMRLALSLAVVTLPYGMIVLLPINIYGKNHLSDTLDKLSMSNVKNGSSSVWAHWVAVWLYSLTVMVLTFREWKVYISFRQRNLLTTSIGSHFAVLVQNLPDKIANDQALKDFVDGLFPNKISGVYVVEDLSVWDDLIQEHDKYVKRWEKAKLYLNTKKERPTVKRHLCSEKQDAITMYESELEIIQERLLQNKMAEKTKYPCGFVFFKSIKARNVALQVIWSNDPLEYDVYPAQDTTEILWDNLLYPRYMKNIRMTVGYVMVFFLVIFYSVPIAFVSSLVHLISIAKEMDWINKFEGSKAFWSLLQGFLPVVLLAGFTLLLPYILRAVARYQGRKYKSEQIMAVFKWLFVFQTFNTFFIYIMAGSFVQNITQIISQPLSLPKLFAKSLPSQAGFFMNYLALLSMAGLAVELTRIIPLLIITIKLKWIAKTQREKLEAWRPPPPEYEVMFSQALLFFLIGLSFSILSPIIIPLFVMYFAFGYGVWLYQLLHVYIPEYEHGGQFWPIVFNKIMICVTVFQILMIGVFSLKLKWLIAGLTFPLLIITYTFWWYMAQNYDKCSRYLSLNKAQEAKFVEKNFLENVRRKYIRNDVVPEVFEVSSEKYLSADEYQPIGSLGLEDDEDEHQMGENRGLLGK